MLNFRYHALSLVAVFLSLVIGLLLGVAIGDKGLVSSAEHDVRASLRDDVRNAQAERDAARAQLAERQRFEQDAYPALVGGRLRRQAHRADRAGRLLRPHVGPDEGRALQGSGAQLVSVSVIREPLRIPELAAAAHGTRYERLVEEPALLHAFGTRLGIQFTQGGTLLGRGAAATCLQQGSGTLNGADGVVIVRSTPQLPKAARRPGRDVRGRPRARPARARRRRSSAIETSDAEISQIGWFKSHELSSVDDLDDTIGRAALVFALAGERGSFGVKATADGGRLPPLLQ